MSAATSTPCPGAHHTKFPDQGMDAKKTSKEVSFDCDMAITAIAITIFSLGVLLGVAMFVAGIATMPLNPTGAFIAELGLCILGQCFAIGSLAAWHLKH
jgi:hypothetical protein